MGKRTQKINKQTHVDPEPVYGHANFEKVSKFLRANLPTKKKFFGKKPAEYFSGKKMIEFLRESKFYVKTDNQDEGVLYEADLLDVAKRLMIHNRIIRCEFYMKKIKKKDGSIKERKELRPSRIGLFDASEDYPYVWNYDPVTKTTVAYGFMMLGGIAACVAMPMWPAWIRNIVIAFLMFILVGRPLLWLFVYLITFSRWNFYVLPRLDEDVCPFDKRFWPLWEFERSETASNPDAEDEDEDDNDDDDEGADEDAGPVTGQEGDGSASDGASGDPAEDGSNDGGNDD